MERNHDITSRVKCSEVQKTLHTINTVKPVYTGHHLELKNWPLNTDENTKEGQI